MSQYRQCDGVTRRDAIRLGILGSAGLTMSSYLRMARAGHVDGQARGKSAILVELVGGPSHIDTFDPKPQGPADIRGSFQAISTNVPGIQVCEHLPQLAKCADKYAVIRGVSHTLGAHPLGQKFVFSGNRPSTAFEYPALGAVVARELSGHSDLPSYVAIPREYHGPGHLGVKYAPMTTNAEPRAGQPFSVRGIQLAGGMTLEQMEKRHSLLRDLDTRFQAIQEQDDLLAGLDEFSQQSFEIITSSRTRRAFDISQEAYSFRQLFGTDGFSQSCLLATRLVESGVRFVTVSMGGWDTHQNNFPRLQNDLLPKLDAGLSGLFVGLDQKGLLDTTTVYVTGEFGRTPTINSGSAQGGRDHYPRCMFMLMAGGGVRGGQVVGDSDDSAAAPRHEGYTPEDVAASFFHSLGIDHRKEYHTSVDRPVAIVRDGNVISPLFG